MHRGFSALALTACVILLGACGGDDDDDADVQPGDRASVLGTSEMAGEGDSPAFALVRGQDTLLVERYTLEGDRVSGVMRAPDGSTVEYETVHSTTGGERSMRVTIRSADPAASLPVVTTFTLRGDSVFLRHARGDSTVQQSDTVPRNALPYLSPSMGMMALVANSARRIVGDSGQVALLAASISQNPVVVNPMVMWRGDTAWVVGNATNQFRMVFSEGRLVSAENAPQQMRAVLLPAGIGTSPTAPAGAGASETAPVTTP